MSLYASLRAACAAPSAPTMVDLAFALSGERLPHDYAFALESALLDALPWLGEDECCGIHAIKAPVTDFGLILSRRSRLVLRIPAERAEDARCLIGRTLKIGEAQIAIGIAGLRPIQPFATLQAWMVASNAADEQGFIDDIAFQLDVLGVRARLICGRREQMVESGREVLGVGLVLHELSPAHSVQLLARGLGPERRLGCGVFVHHKIIEGLGDEPD